MPRPKPPFPANKGLFGRPTLINNVETLANIPVIMLHGADWFAQMGTETSKGTKTFALTGDVNNTGLIEIPMGTTLREIVFDIGGGMRDGKKFKAVQIGGPSGGCLTEEHLDIPMDYDNLIKAGAMVGSGGLVVMSDKTCIVEVARFFMNFTQNESCGKCVPCREGTKNMLAILQKIVDGKEINVYETSFNSEYCFMAFAAFIFCTVFVFYALRKISGGRAYLEGENEEVLRSELEQRDRKLSNSEEN